MNVRAEKRIRDDAARRLGKAFEKVDALNLPSLTPEEVQAEIVRARAWVAGSSPGHDREG